MSHELRTPLNVILGYAELLLLGLPTGIPDSARVQVERIRLAAKHLLQMIEEILTLSRVESGSERIQVEPVDMCEFVEETAALVEPLAREKELTFVCEAPPAPTSLRLDVRKTRQILLNLLSNAVKFTQEGEIELAARMEGPIAVFTVRDSGIGIDPEDRERIFDAFWQVEQGHSRRTEGAGLGLNVTRRLARLLGGDVTVRERAGGGSEFEVRLPSPPGDDGTSEPAGA
jgi:signal transduction histidine kinase